MPTPFPVLGVPHCAPCPAEARLRSTYLAARYGRAPAIMPAAQALAKARATVAAGRHAYAPRGPVSALGAPFADGLQWAEAPDALGLRYVGPAADLAGLRHTGWNLDPDGLGETARGVVYRLPTRQGVARFVPAVADPYQDGPAMVALRHVCAADAADAADLESAQAEAARIADGLAEAYADRERDHAAAYAAGAAYAAERETADAAAAEFLDSLHAARRVAAQDARAAELLRGAARSAARAWRRARSKAQAMRAEAPQGGDLGAAWAEGAGL